MIACSFFLMAAFRLFSCRLRKEMPLVSPVS